LRLYHAGGRLKALAAVSIKHKDRACIVYGLEYAGL